MSSFIPAHCCSETMAGVSNAVTSVRFVGRDYWTLRLCLCEYPANAIAAIKVPPLNNGST